MLQQLVTFFIDQASINGEHLAGMLFAGIVILGIVCIAGYQVLDLLIEWLKRIRPIKINRVQKIDKIVEVPKYVENKKEYAEILKRLEAIEKAQKDGVKL
jgi:SNF family Na+-dependent transporter